MGEKCHQWFNFGKNTQPLDIQDQKHSQLHWNIFKDSPLQLRFSWIFENARFKKLKKTKEKIEAFVPVENFFGFQKDLKKQKLRWTATNKFFNSFNEKRTESFHQEVQ